MESLKTSDKWRFGIGGMAVFGLIAMGFAFGLGRVEEQTSFGLIPVLSFLGMVVGRFAEWAYYRLEPGSKPSAIPDSSGTAPPAES